MRESSSSFSVAVSTTFTATSRHRYCFASTMAYLAALTDASEPLTAITTVWNKGFMSAPPAGP